MSDTPDVRALPCPFCGEQPEVIPSGDGTGIMIECMTPHCVNPHVSYYGEDVAAKHWNTRAATALTAQAERIAELEAALTKLGDPPVEAVEAGVRFVPGHYDMQCASYIVKNIVEAVNQKLLIALLEGKK